MLTTKGQPIINISSVNREIIDAMKNNLLFIWISVLTLAGAVLIFISSCKKDNIEMEINDFAFGIEAYPDMDGDTLTIILDGEPIVVEFIEGDYIYQGDIIIAIDNQKSTKGAAIVASRKRWPKGIVYYAINNDFPKKERVTEAIKRIENKTDIQFFERTNEKNYIEFVNHKGNSSYLGMIGGRQKIRISDNAPTYVVIHEIGHALGLIHEHCRADRDEYVDILWINIKPSKLNNFSKNRRIISTEKFDYKSIMLYSSYSFSRNKKETMVKIDGNNLSHNFYLSDGDIEMIRQMYSATTYNMEFATDIPIALERAGVTSTTVNNSIYVFGGYAGSEPYSDRVYKYNISTDNWSDLGSILPYGTSNSTNNVAVHNSSLFYITPSHGPYSYNGWGQNKEILEYDVNNNSIDIKAAYPVNSWNISPIAHDNYIYLFGRHTGSDHKDIFRYQSSTNELINLGQILPYISSLPLAVKGNKDDIYLFGGRTYKKSLVVFDPTNETIKYNEENFLPFELTGGAAWSNGNIIFVIEPATGKVYEYDSNDHSFNESSFQIFENNTLYRPMVSKDESTGVVYLISGREGDNLVNTVRKLIPTN